MDIENNKKALARLRDAADNASMLQTKESMEEFWVAYNEVKETENILWPKRI
jgi:hypothetical protein